MGQEENIKSELEGNSESNSDTKQQKKGLFEGLKERVKSIKNPISGRLDNLSHDENLQKDVRTVISLMAAFTQVLGKIIDILLGGSIKGILKSGAKVMKSSFRKKERPVDNRRPSGDNIGSSLNPTIPDINVETNTSNPNHFPDSGNNLGTSNNVVKEPEIVTIKEALSPINDSETKKPQKLRTESIPKRTDNGIKTSTLSDSFTTAINENDRDKIAEVEKIYEKRHRKEVTTEKQQQRRRSV